MSGCVQGLSWYRTHPPFYRWMKQAEQEILYLANKKQFVQQTTEFLRMKDELKQVRAPTGEEERDQPSLLASEQDCSPPPRIDYKPGQRIEDVCSLPSPEGGGSGEV